MEREIRPFLDGSGCQGERIPITYGERMTISFAQDPLLVGAPIWTLVTKGIPARKFLSNAVIVLIVNRQGLNNHFLPDYS